jgi:peroxiredoxin Q/BCP
MHLNVGDKAPDIALPDQDGNVRRLSDLKGKTVLLYFYPKDDTPGCTAEACAFRDEFASLKRAGVEVIGVSTDPPAKHAKFAAKYELPFTLLADEDKDAVKAYGVWGLKKFMGREYLGTRRVSFLIGPDGRIAKIYDKVKPAAHAEEVLADAKALGGA